MKKRNLKLVAIALVFAHLIISMIHGREHQGAMVALTSWQSIYVLVVITVGPILGAAFLYSRWQRPAALLLAISMFGSLVFGGWYHFLSATTDNVAAVHGVWHSTFLWSAIAIAILEAAGLVVGSLIYQATASPSR